MGKTMQKILRSYTLVVILLTLPILIAGCSPRNPVSSVDDSPTPEITASAVPTSTTSPTLKPPTPTETPVPPTQTPTHTPTHTLIPTATSEPPSLVVMQDSECRFGPGTFYDIRAYLSEGDNPVLIGHSEDDDWWNVEEPIFNVTCWLSSNQVSVNGDVSELPVFTPEPTPTAVPSATPDIKGMKVFLVALGTGGPFGCGDGLVYFYSGKQKTGDVARDTKTALHALFKIKSKYVGDYYNPIYNAHLIVKNVDVNHATGKVTVFLEGSIPKPADECEAKRVHDQVWETARQISGYRNIGIHVGNKLLGDLIAVGDR